MRKLALWTVPGILALGCGASQPAPAMVRGDIDAAPDMTILPSLDRPLDEMSPAMREGWLLAEEAFEIPLPPPPDTDTQSYTAWAEGDLRRWLRRKSHTVESAREELDRAADEDSEERIVAGGIVGLLYEDVGRELLSIPTPQALIEDPEIGLIFREVLEGEAAPYLERSNAAYRACAINADAGPESLRHWRRFCAGRRVELPLDDS
ncbi:MAG: hypothetical protein AAGF12_27635 [Myxococcota bacterium]